MRVFYMLCIIAAVMLSLGLTPPAHAKTDLKVYAAASLTEYLKEMKTVFEKAHSNVNVRLTFASSAECRLQISQGAPGDVFLSADTTNMDLLVADQLADQPTIFAKNSLIVIASKSRNVSTLANLTRPKLKLVIANRTSPIGKYTRAVLRNIDRSGKYGRSYEKNVMANVVSEEQNVKAVVIKVFFGEADAGFCYLSDANQETLKQVKVIPIPAQLNVVAEYPVAILSRSKQKALAKSFIDLLLSAQGQTALTKYKFVPVKVAAPKPKPKPASSVKPVAKKRK